MVEVIKKTDPCTIEQVSLRKLVIYCNPDSDMLDAAFPINIILAKRLLDMKPDRRAMRMERAIQKILVELPDNLVIKDFDVMFNPAYEIDVLKIFVSLRRSKMFSLIWPGTLTDGKLIYAEESYRDYKVYDINKYDVACVI